MLSLANYFRSKTARCFAVVSTHTTTCTNILAKNYWAKDLVFLVTSEGEIGMEAWMDAYLGQQSPGEIAWRKKKKKKIVVGRIRTCAGKSQ